MDSMWNGGGLRQYVAAISGSMCYTIMGAAVAWPSPVLIMMDNNEAPLKLDTTQISWMVSLMFLGHISSPLPTGYLMDIFGRKKTCLYLSILPLISWLLIFFATTAIHLYIARFMVGLYIGIITTVMPLYVGEIAGPKLRHSLTTINNLLLNFGVLFVYVMGTFVSYSSLAIACEAVTVVYICMFCFMPESPYHYMKHDQQHKAFEVLSWLRKNQGKEEIENEVRKIERSIEEQKVQKGTLRDIFFDEGNRKAFTISITYAILKRTSGSGVLQAYASITLPKTTLGILDPDMCVIIIGFVSLLSSLLSTILSAKYKRNILLSVSCVGCALTMAVVMIWFYLKSNTNLNVTNYSDVIFIAFVLYYSVFNIGLGPIGTSIKGEIFSTNVKGLSSSLTTLVVAFSGFVMNKFYLIIADGLGMYINYFVYCLSCVVAIVFTWCCLPDTHNKSLEEIRALLKDGRKRNDYSSAS